MQEIATWSPPSGPLGRLTLAAHERARLLASSLPRFRERAAELVAPPSFVGALRGTTIAVVAEIKRRSPSKGILNDQMRPRERAAAYVRGGAAALSVLTEPAEFGGDNADVSEVLASVPVPVLKKDFHVDESQVWEARALGASALLLIARALAPGRLERMVDEALRAGIEPLVEVRTLQELARALATATPAIGVNARDLETLDIDVTVTQRVLSAIPGDRVAVAESGLVSRIDVERVAHDGADAVLIGSALSYSADAEGAVRSLAAVPRRGRGA